MPMVKVVVNIRWSRKNYYPGWHMNKKSWYTIVLNGSVPNDELRERITESYELAGK